MNDLQLIGDNIKLELKKSAVITPGNYSFENALKSAYLILQETVDRNKRPALEVCSPESIHNALMHMATLGLNPAKKQCYFVVYGTQLQCITSYMGAQMTAKAVNPAINDIRAQVIYQGDDIEIDIVNGRDTVTKHKRKFQDISKAEIVGAYALAVASDELLLFCEIMTMDEIKASWKQSKMSAVAESGAINQNTTHGKFTGEMAKRTVINRLCKRIINTSDDSALLASVAATDEDIAETEIIQREIEQNANQKLIDFPAPEPVETDPGPEMATEDQIKELYAIEKANNKADKVLENVSSFVGRKVAGLSELNHSEAAEYIEMLKEEKQNQGPDWG